MFSEGEVEFIKENMEKMTLKQIALAMDRPYASVHDKALELRRFVPRGNSTKKKYIPPPPREKTFERPPAVYSNKQYGELYDL